MSATVPYSAKITGSTGTTSSATIIAPTAGQTLLVMAIVPTGMLPVINFTDNQSNSYVLDHSQSGLSHSTGTCSYLFYRKSNLSGTMPTQVSLTGTASGTVIFELGTATALDNVSPVESVINTTVLTGSATTTSHTLPFSTTNAKSLVMMGFSTPSSCNMSSVSGGFAVVLPESTPLRHHLAFLADAGAAGSYSSTVTLSSASQAYKLGVIYKIAVPVVTITGSSVPEGTAIRFTLTMASDPGATTAYSYAWGGTGVGGTDYDSNLANATFSAGLSFTGGSIQFASGTTTGTIDVTTYDNALDQPDRTLILTVGGVASTGGTITDNDPAPTVTFSDGVESFGVVTCTATLGAVSGKDVSFQVDTTNGTKTAGTHYTAIVAQTVTIPAGSLTAAITVNTL